MDGWMDGWVGGWMEAKAGLRIAYSNQKCCILIEISGNAWVQTLDLEHGTCMIEQ